MEKLTKNQKTSNNLTSYEEKEFENLCKKLSDPNYSGGSWALSENPTALEKSKYDICKKMLVYKQDHHLSTEQIAAMKAELESGAPRGEIFSELLAALKSAGERVRAFSPADFELPRTIGRQQMPTTVGGILVHVADHTQRHVGQAITTAKVVKGR